MKKRGAVFLGLTLVLLITVSTFGPPVGKLASAYVPPPRTTTGLKELVEKLMAATPLGLQIDSDNDTLYDCVEHVIGTDFNNTDSDFDLLDDYTEVMMDSDPLDPDTNSDGLSDYMEVKNVTSLDLDRDNSTNIWDYDNDGDGVNDGVDLSPFSLSTLSDSFHFDVTTNGKPTYINLQFRPRNPENLKLYAQIWDWPNDSEGIMKDLDGSLEDAKVIPQLNVTVNVRPNQADVAEFGILVTDYGMHVPVYPVWENDEVVAFSAMIFYNSSSPLTLSMDARLIWRVLGNTDEKARALQASNGKYVSIGADGRLVANASGITLLETFQWLDAGENKTVLKVHDGPYVTVTSDGSLVAFGSDVGSAQTFELVSEGNMTSLKAYNGKYVSVASDGTLMANSTATGNSTAFLVIDRGCLSDWAILVTYKEPFTLTGFTVSDSWGCNLGLFYSANKELTVRANVLLSNDFLRNSTTRVQDLPSILGGYGVSVSSLIKSFSIQEEAFVDMSNTMLPKVLDSLPPNQTLPVIMCVEENRTSVEMSQFASGSYVLGSSYSVNLSANVEPMITAKTLKTNFYETTGYKALQIEDIIRDIASWQLSEQARFSLSNLMLAWNTGEQIITGIGSQDTTLWTPPDCVGDVTSSLDLTLTVIDTLGKIGAGLRESTWLKGLKGWTVNFLARFLKTGADESLGFLTTMVKKINTAKESLAGIKGVSILGDLMDGLAVVGTLVDIGMTFLTAVMLAEQVGGHLGQSWGASFGIVAISYTLIYMGILTAIGEIPYVGPLLVLALVLADFFGGFSDWLSDLFMDWFGPDDLSVVEAWMEEIGVPDITFSDKDGNGFDVGDRVSITLATKTKVNVTSGSELGWAWYSWYRPYVSITAPYGSNSNTSMTGVPPTAKINTTSGTDWKTEESETGAWIEPGIGMPNFPISVQLNVDYKLYHVWEHFVFYVFYWEWCRHEDANQGVSSSHLFTAYYDVLPENIDDFRTWRGITPLDHDYDGLADVNETRSNPYKYDTDADGLNDRFENITGTNPSNYDTDSDGLPDCYEVVFGTNATNTDTDGDKLPDYLELAGWVVPFSFLGNTSKNFTMRVFSDPRVADTDGDGVNDYMEYWSDLNPRSNDTNGDGIQDVANPHFVGTDLTFIRSLNMTSNIVDIGVDADGTIYVLKNYWVESTQSNAATILKYSYDGILFATLPLHSYYYSMVVDEKDSCIYLANASYDGGSILKLNLNGTLIKSIAVSNPIDSMDIDADGYLYTSCYKWGSFVGVIKYAPNGTMVDSWGSRGDEPDQFQYPGAIAVDKVHDYVYVIDNRGYNNTRVTKWTNTGDYLTTIPGNFVYLSDVTVDTYGFVYVTDEESNVYFNSSGLQKFDSNGIPIASWGRLGVEDGNLTNPLQVVVDSQGFVYVVDTTGPGEMQEPPYPFGRIQKFSQGEPEKPPFNDPITDRDGDGLTNIMEDAGWNATFTNATGTFTIHVTSDRLINDTDNDGLSDYLEFQLALNPRSPDTDGDGVSDFAEYQWHHSPGMNPANYDTDGDGLDDGTELAYGSDPTKPDTDFDGLSDLQEFNLRTNANCTDTDKDGLSDYQEVQFGSDPTNPDTDGDLQFDSAELSQGTNPRSNDTDHDGLIDGHESILGTNATNGDTDGDKLPDGFEVNNWLNPISNDTDGDGLSDLAELQKGTNPLNPDSDFDGIPDGQDPDSNGIQVPNVVLAFDVDDATQEFAAKLAQYTNVTVVSKEQLLANYTNAPYIVLVGRPDGNGTVGNLIHDILSDSGDVLTNMMKSDDYRFAVRYGLWNSTQTIVTLSTPYPSDYVRVLDILRSKIVTMLPDSTNIQYNMSLAVRYPDGGSLNHQEITSTVLFVDEIDTVKATDTTLTAFLAENSNVTSVQIAKYNATTTPHPLTYSSRLQSPEQAIGKYISITMGNSRQTGISNTMQTAMIKIYYKEADLDRTGNGRSGDPGDIAENTLTLYIFDATSNTWRKLAQGRNGVADLGINTTNVEVYGEKYAGYVWVQLSLANVSFFGLAGLQIAAPPNKPPNTNPVAVTNLNTFTPRISWTYADQNSDPQVMYEVEVSLGPKGSVTIMWDYSRTGTLTSIAYAGAPLEPGQTYYARVRAFDGTDWGSWSETSFSITAQYTLIMYVIGEGTVTPGNGTYSTRAKVDINAFSASGWAFQGWTGDACTTTNTSITMTGNITVIATFIRETEVNRPPDVTKAHASIEILWPPNGEMVEVNIEGVTDPNGDRVAIEIVGIESNEPTAPTDYYGIGTDTAWLKAERLTTGTGRIYTITFLANDCRGAYVLSSVSVLVPLIY